MRRKLSFLIVITFNLTWPIVNAQQLPLYSQYRWNDYVINPAFTGASDIKPIQLSYRKQWIGFNGSPTTVSVGGHTSINKSMGIGCMLYNDNMGGAFSQTGIILNYAYHIRLSHKSSLSFGTSSKLIQYNFNPNEINTLYNNDLALISGKQTGTITDASLGVLFQHKKRLKLGFAVDQLLQSKLKKITSYNQYPNQFVIHYNFMCFYTLHINKLLDINPSILLKSTATTPIQIDFGGKFDFRKKFWLGFAYRPKDAVVALLGIQHNRMVISYSYDISVSDIRHSTSGSGEIMVGYHILTQKKDWSVQQ